ASHIAHKNTAYINLFRRFLTLTIVLSLKRLSLFIRTTGLGLTEEVSLSLHPFRMYCAYFFVPMHPDKRKTEIIINRAPVIKERLIRINCIYCRNKGNIY